MNSLGLNLVFRMGCMCAKPTVEINGQHYRVKERLGEGGFSQVDLIENSRSRKQYALKRIACHSKSDERDAVQEVEYHKTFHDCPFVLDCVDSALRGVPDIMRNNASELLIVLPYHRRGTLQDELQRLAKRCEHFDEKYILQIFRHICDGVKAMHHATPHSLAHRDLKPANILLSDQGDATPVIMDLGSMCRARQDIKSSAEARAAQDLAAERSTMPYRAPELFNIESQMLIDERSDIWSLGCLLYALCFYKSPFDSVHERGDSVALAVMTGNISIPENSPYTEGLCNLIRFQLIVNPSERPFIDDVIEKTDQLIGLQDNVV